MAFIGDKMSELTDPPFDTREPHVPEKPAPTPDAEREARIRSTCRTGAYFVSENEIFLLRLLDDDRAEIARHLGAIEVWQREAQSARVEIEQLESEIARLRARVNHYVKWFHENEPDLHVDDLELTPHLRAPPGAVAMERVHQIFSADWNDYWATLPIAVYEEVKRRAIRAIEQAERNASKLSREDLKYLLHLKREARDAALEDAAQAADQFTEPRILAMWDRPGGPPGNGYVPLRGKHIALAIRALIGKAP
jgi:hypothetical protein